MKTISDEKIIEWLEENGKDVYTYSELEDLYEETLDEVYPEVKIGDVYARKNDYVDAIEALSEEG